jgi:hypothetical protein
VGRTDRNTIATPGKEPDDALAVVIAGKFDANPHLSTQKLAQSLGIAASAVCRCLTEVLGMKGRHLSWVPHTLIFAEKVMHTELAHSMLRVLAKHKHTN